MKGRLAGGGMVEARSFDADMMEEEHGGAWSGGMMVQSPICRQQVGKWSWGYIYKYGS